MLEEDPITALFTRKAQGLLVTLYENERPLQGLAGLLDWKFHGAVQKFLKQKPSIGKLGECVYFPLRRNQDVFHLILVGCGTNEEPGKRPMPPKEVFQKLRSTLPKLGLSQIGLSRSDMGSLSKKELLNLVANDKGAVQIFS